MKEYKISKPKLKAALNKFCNRFADVEISSVKESAEGNLILHFNGFKGFCVIDPFCKILSIQATVPPAIKEENNLNISAFLTAEEIEKKREEIQQELNKKELIQLLPCAKDIQNIDVRIKKGDKVYATIMYIPEGNIEDPSRNASVFASIKGTVSEISKVLFTQLKEGKYLKNVKISKKKRKELKNWAETTLKPVADAVLSLYEKYYAKRKYLTIPMPEGVFFSWLQKTVCNSQLIFSEKFEIIPAKSCNKKQNKALCTKKWKIPYGVLSAEYDLRKDECVSNCPNVVLEEAVFWDEHFEEILALSQKLQEVATPEIKISFSLIISNNKFMVNINANSTYVDDMNIVIDMLEPETVKNALEKIKEMHQRGIQHKEWIKKTKSAVLQITGGVYKDRWTYLKTSDESPMEPTLMLETAANNLYNTYCFHPSQESKEILGKIRSDHKGFEGSQQTFAGNVLYRGIYAVVNANTNRITENDLIKVLRGKVLSGNRNYTVTEFTGKFEDLHEDVVKAAVEDLIKSRIIKKGIISGPHANYYVLFPNPYAELSYLFEYAYAPHTDETKAENYTDDDWIEVLQEEIPSVDQADKWMDFTYILDHHGLVCFAMDEISTFFAKGPETIQTYIEACKITSSTLVERRMYAKLLEKIQEEITKVKVQEEQV